MYTAASGSALVAVPLAEWIKLQQIVGFGP